MKCNNAGRNCRWKGTVGTIEKHLTTCKFALLPCPKKCKDGRSKKIKHVLKKNLEKHLTKSCPNRDYTCKYCGEESTYATIKEVHDAVCEKKIVPCTNTGCLETLQRQHISQHVESECEHTVIACKHKSIGCETELKRKDMATHELDDKFHLHMAINTVTMLKEDTLKKGKSMKIIFVDYQAKKDRKGKFTSPPFYTSHGYNMALEVYPNGAGDGEDTHVSVYAKRVEGKHDSCLGWPPLGSITFTLLNQLKDKTHYIMEAPVTSESKIGVGYGWGHSKFIPHSALGHDPIENTQYLKDDTLHFRVLVEVEDNKPWLECEANM